MTDAADDFLPYGRQLIDDDDIAAVAEVLRGDWLTGGPGVAAFEAAFAAKVGAAYAVSCSSGTAALHLAALALGLGEGDRVAVPSLTFLATANAARYVGAEVAFADVEADSGLMGADELQAVLDGPDGDRVAAVFPVHLNGQAVDMEALSALARARGIKVVEDACHALGGKQVASDGNMTPVGNCRCSDMTVFSLHPVKTIAAGEGGMITTNDAGLHERLCRLRNHGMIRDAARFELADQALGADGAANPWYYEMPEIGFNYRLSDIHAALGASQLGKLEKFVSARLALAACYDRELADLAPVLRPVGRARWARPAWHLYAVLIDFARLPLDRAGLTRRLQGRGIGTQVHYLPVHRQPYYRRRYGALALAGADRYFDRCLSLPLHAGMAEGDVRRVVAALAEAMEGEGPL